MIKIIFSTILFLISISSSSQQANPDRKLTQEDYLKKSRNQKKAAFVVLAAGTGFIIASAIIPKGELISMVFVLGHFVMRNIKMMESRALF